MSASITSHADWEALVKASLPAPRSASQVYE